MTASERHNRAVKPIVTAIVKPILDAGAAARQSKAALWMEQSRADGGRK